LSVLNATSRTPISMVPNATYQTIARAKCSETPKLVNANQSVIVTMPT
jgi:hypothetical protein